jgi:hypothetical protein
MGPVLTNKSGEAHLSSERERSSKDYNDGEVKCSGLLIFSV